MIGVFDSGVGGLSILREIRARGTRHDIVYVADQAFAPYGDRSLEAVRQRSVAIASYLHQLGAHTVVVACNSASAAALNHLRAVFPSLPFVGMEPAVKPAAENSHNGVVGVLATPATFQGELYASVVDRHASHVDVVAVAATGLATAVEEGRIEAIEPLLERYLDPMRDSGIDRLVLGCTHYPFVADQIRRHLGDGVELVDPSAAVARQVTRVAGDPAQGEGMVRYMTTGDPIRFRDQIRRLLGEEVETHRVVVR